MGVGIGRNGGSRVRTSPRLDVWLGGGMVGRLGLVFGELGDTLILDVGNISTVALNISMVVNNLGAAVGKGHSVGALNQVGVRVLLLVKVGTGVVIMHAILESVWLGWLCVAMDGLVHNRMNGEGMGHNGGRMGYDGGRMSQDGQVSGHGGGGSGQGSDHNFGKHGYVFFGLLFD